MNPSDELRLHRLATAVCGGLVTDDEVRELDRLLSSDPQSRAMYIAYLDIHSALADRGHEKQKAASGIKDGALNPGTSHVANRKVTCRTTACSHRERMWWGAALAASILLAITAALSDFQGEVTSDSDNGKVAVGGVVPGIGILSFNEGTLQMSVPAVGTLLVDGPAQMEFLSPMRLRLDKGRIKVHVTEKSGYGFVVPTPHGDVTDLGTEFAIDVNDMDTTNLVVFDGKVDLSMPGKTNTPQVERLIGGEGVRFASDGHFNRIMSIVTGSVATFRASTDFVSDVRPVILSVSDNIPTKESKRFYAIVPGGFTEDALAFVDRPHQWNGIRRGLPVYLRNADYVKTFNDYKNEQFQLTVQVSCPCDLYVLWDDRIDSPPWLTESFERMKDMVGLDEAGGVTPSYIESQKGVGPGDSIDRKFKVYKRVVPEPGAVQLGSLNTESKATNMYGIVAVAHEPTESAAQEGQIGLGVVTNLSGQ